MATSDDSSPTPLLSEKPWVWIAVPLGILAALGALAVLLHTQRRKRHKARHLVSSDPIARQALERDLQEAWVRGARGPPPPVIYPGRPPESWHAHAQSELGGHPGSQVRAPGRTYQVGDAHDDYSHAVQARQASGQGQGHHHHHYSHSTGQRARWVRPAATRWAWAHNMLQVRAEEGLNEFGEAPPPYDGKKRDGQGVKLDDDEDGGDRPVVEMHTLQHERRAGGGGSNHDDGGGDLPPHPFEHQPEQQAPPPLLDRDQPSSARQDEPIAQPVPAFLSS